MPKLLRIWTVLLLLIASACAPAERDRPRPNILVIMVDDLGWGDVGYHGAEIRTPTLDRLAASGVRLDRHYAYPVCSPTRAALLTGRSALAMGVDGPMENDVGMPLDERLLPQMLRAHGYQTFMVGKWHLGMHHVAYFPQARGFDYFYGHLGGFVDFYSHVYFDRLDWQRNGVSVQEAGYATDLLAADAVAVLKRRDRDRPFFLFLSLNAPHTPLHAPPSIEATYGHIADDNRRVYAAMVEVLDGAIGRVLDALAEDGALANTLVVFASDNGGNERAGADNGALRGGKGGVFEGGIRVPALLAWPDGVAGGRVVSQMITAEDWVPTLLSAAGLSAGLAADGDKPLDGIDMWPAIAEDRAVQRGAVVLGAFQSLAVFEDGWKLARVVPKQGGAARTYLFRIDDDPTETHDLASRHPDVVARLTAHLERTPRGRSLASTAPPPEEGWRRPDGSIDYGIRLPVRKRPGWAEAADRD